MKFLSSSKDGGPESTVTAYWLFEIKWLCSIALLRFDQGSRDVFHNHAFNSISWLLSGQLREVFVGTGARNYLPSIFPIFTYRNTMHKVFGVSPRSWVLTFRGPWSRRWNEYHPNQETTTLTHGRQEVARTR